MKENETTNKKRHFTKKKIATICACTGIALGAVALGVYSFFGGAKASRYSDLSNSRLINTITTPTDYEKVERDTNIYAENGVLKVERVQKIDKSMGEDGTWTILMYVCGTDLERVFNGATKDFNEIMEAGFSSETLEKFNIIIQTGGSKEWKSNNISTEKIQRYKVVEGGKLKLLETLNKDSMGNPKVLSEFLEWGVDNYPAKHMGVIFWDHGAGPLKGVCSDENYQNYMIASNGKNELMTTDVFTNDMLTLPEMEYSFSKTYKTMDSRFEFIGFDTCLSGNIEIANVLAPYAKYMIASAEIEPGDGWHYTPIMKYIIENPDCNGYDVGKVVCDSYMDYYFNRDAKDDITIATYDLGRIDNAMIELNYLVKYFNDMIEKDKSIINKIMEMEGNVVRFGNFKELVDIGSLITYIERMGAFDYNVRNLKHALKEAVAYKKLSERYTYPEVGLMGMTMYYPKNIISYSTFLEYRNISYSPYHMSFLEKMNYSRYNYDWNSYVDYNWAKSEYYFEKTFGFLDKLPLNIYYEPMLHNTMSTYEGYAQSGFLEALYNNFSMYSPLHQGGFTRNTFDVKFEKNIVENEGRCIAKLDKESKKYVDDVYATVFAKVGKDTYCLGENARAKYNEAKGIIESSLKKEWFMLPDGQFLTTYISEVDTKNNRIIYSIPVLYNETEVSIRIEEKAEKNGTYTYKCLGIWDATKNSSYAPRGYYPLKVGDIITPMYDVYVEEAQNYETEYGEDYMIQSDFDFLFGKLPKGKYSYAYTLKCMNGYDIYSDVIDFAIDK